MTEPDRRGDKCLPPSWQELELAAVEWMRRLGFRDAALTNPGADGGLDGRATGAVAQVKAYSIPVGRPDVQRLKGAAHNVEAALFFSWNGYTPGAVVYAEAANVALFAFRGGVDDLVPVNEPAQEMFRRARPVPDHSARPETNEHAGNRGVLTQSLLKLSLACFAVGLAVLVSPALFVLGAEARRRSGDADRVNQLGSVLEPGALRNRTAAWAAGALGALILGGAAVQNFAWKVAGTPTELRTTYGWSVLGVAAGAALVWGLFMLVRAGRMTWVPIPSALLGEAVADHAHGPRRRKASYEDFMPGRSSGPTLPPVQGVNRENP